MDLALGLPPHSTLTRQGILELLRALDQRNVSVYDCTGLESDPLDEERISGLQSVVDRYLSQAQGMPEYMAIEAQAEALRRRPRRVGARGEPRIIIVGEKPSR